MKTKKVSGRNKMLTFLRSLYRLWKMQTVASDLDYGSTFDTFSWLNKIQCAHEFGYVVSRKNRGIDWTLGINTNSNAAKDVHDELDLKLRPNQMPLPFLMVSAPVNFSRKSNGKKIRGDWIVQRLLKETRSKIKCSKRKFEPFKTYEKLHANQVS